MTATVLEAAQAVVDGAVGTPDGVLVPVRLLDELAEAVDRADTNTLHDFGGGPTDTFLGSTS